MRKKRFHLHQPCSSSSVWVCRCFFQVPMTTSEAVWLHPSVPSRPTAHPLRSNSLAPPHPPSPFQSICVKRIAAAAADGVAVVAKNTPCQKHAPVGIETLTVAGRRALHVPGLENKTSHVPLPSSSYFFFLSFSRPSPPPPTPTPHPHPLLTAL